MIKTAELTGQLAETLSFLADYSEKDLTMRNRIRNALIYPAIVIILFLLIAGIMVAFVFPQLEPIFQESGVSLPVLTNLLLSSGYFLRQWWYIILIVLGLFVLLFREYLRIPEGRAVSQEIFLRLPVLGNLFKKIYTTRFACSASVLIKGGVPIAQAIEISAYSIGSAIYQEIFLDVANSIRKGEMLSSSLAQYENYFSPLVVQMVSVGESTGRLDELLIKVSNFCSREIDDTISNLVELIQPILIIIIGGFVGLLFASILLPIYNLSQVIR